MTLRGAGSVTRALTRSLVVGLTLLWLLGVLGSGIVLKRLIDEKSDDELQESAAILMSLVRHNDDLLVTAAVLGEVEVPASHGPAHERLIFQVRDAVRARASAVAQCAGRHPRRPAAGGIRRHGRLARRDAHRRRERTRAPARRPARRAPRSARHVAAVADGPARGAARVRRVHRLSRVAHAGQAGAADGEGRVPAGPAGARHASARWRGHGDEAGRRSRERPDGAARRCARSRAQLHVQQRARTAHADRRRAGAGAARRRHGAGHGAAAQGRGDGRLAPTPAQARGTAARAGARRRHRAADRSVGSTSRRSRS